MENLLGRLEAYLAEKEIEASDELVFLINTRIKPPVAVKKEDIYIRAMYLISDQVNSFGGCFPLDEHPKLAELLVDSPVLVGHSKERLPVARNFKADLVNKDGVNWVKVYFYWLKNSPEAESLKENIDHGIYKECSIGFSFEFPECSICGEDMRRCQHVPFRTYQKENGKMTQAHFNYRQIIKVHETSLVYRGAVFGTSITNELDIFQKHDCSDGICKFKRAYKESILESLRKAGIDEEVKIVGEIAEKGYSEDKIELSCEKDLEEMVLSSIPQVLRGRVFFVNTANKEGKEIISSRFVLLNSVENNSEDYRLRFMRDPNSSFREDMNSSPTQALLLYRLDVEKLRQGRRFLCDFSQDESTEDGPESSGSDLSSEEKVIDEGECQALEANQDFFNLNLKGETLQGVYLLRKIRLKGKERWLFYKKINK